MDFLIPPPTLFMKGNIVMNLWNVPACDPLATEHADNTLVKPVRTHRLKKAGLPSDGLRYWGADKSAPKSASNAHKLAVGDYVIFYVGSPEDRALYLAKVKKTPDMIGDHAKVSTALWDTAEWIPYAVSRPIQINTTTAELNAKLDYEGDGSPWGFQRVKEDRYETVPKFVLELLFD
jgi:hypothetical protein